MINHESRMTEPLGNLLKNLCLPTFASCYQQLAEDFETDQKTNLDYLYELTLREMEHRHNQRIMRLLKQAKLTRDKLLINFDISRIAGLSPSKIQHLAKGEFTGGAENIIIFGNPGTGKTHLAISLGLAACGLGLFKEEECCIKQQQVWFNNFLKQRRT